MFDEHPLSTTWLATPGPVGKILLLGNDVNVPDVAVKVYGVPTTPAKVQFDTFTTPAAAVKPVQDDKVPPEDVRLIEAVDEVTTLPAESSTFTTGCAVRAAPDAPAAGWVVKTNWLATPGPVGEKLPLGDDVKVPDVAVKV
jgi:hypothetical protein